MDLADMKKAFESERHVYESAKLTFTGIDGYDVYNPSIPFCWRGKEYILGRVEKRERWASSCVRLFAKTGTDTWQLVPDAMIYPLEDPYVAFIGDEITMGGTHVRKECGKVATFNGYFYRGTDIDDLCYFTTGPDRMKDIRLVDLGGKIGVFSRPRGESIRKQYGSESVIGYAEINTLDELSPAVIEKAEPIQGLFSDNQWGGCNQVYLLEDGTVGVVGHISYRENDLSVYMNMSYVFDRTKHQASELKLLGTRACYPHGSCKVPKLADCVFTAGIVMRPDGKCDLYSGLGDVESGRIVIDYPFKGHGPIVTL
ncbi:DUF1861 family protein [Ruminococcaceae bacterium OttesenSCG-928-L11]|nr:DUF1861 family protein [Ruminococcaceae bacterium OttesenSCG-928-L11]